MAEGFLGRWSQRKQAQREGKVLAEPATPTVSAASLATSVAAPARPAALAAAQAVNAESAAQTTRPDVPLPSLEDVTRLTSQSDFSPFVAREVAPEVRNAAMKKLFADPHYQVMDGLDIYIDDYSKPDPLPLAMLRQMASAKFLNLFDEEPADAKVDSSAAGLGDDANTAAVNSVAQSDPQPASGAQPLIENQPPETGLDHDHTDLRLQQDHAAGPQKPGCGAQ
jgi:hypothetical protein